MTNDGSRYALTQYRWPLDYEPAGQSFTLVSGGAAHRLAFRDREFVDCDGVLSRYEALKLDSDVHFIVFGETLSVALLDLGRGTAVFLPDGAEDYEFCRVEGFGGGSGADALPGDTDEMSGTHVRWYFGCERYVEHTYLENESCRCVWSPREDRARIRPAKYVKLSEAKYLVEVDGTAPLRADLPQSYSRLILAQDYERLLTVGCIYSPTLNDFRMISGYAMEP